MPLNKPRPAVNHCPKALIFDLDGTLLDSMPAHVKAWRRALNELGLNLDDEFFYLNEGALDHATMAPIRREIGSPLDDREFFARLLARQRRIYNEEHSAGVSLYEEAQALVETAREQGLSLALVTSSNHIVLPRWLTGWLKTYFKLVITGDMVEHFKPHPEPYLKALEGLRLEASQAVAIENAPAGVRSAKAAGLDVLALTTTLKAEIFSGLAPVMPDHKSLLAWLRDRPRPAAA